MLTARRELDDRSPLPYVLENAGYVEVEKVFVDRKPRTSYRLSGRGRDAWETYRRMMRGLLG